MKMGKGPTDQEIREIIMPLMMSGAKMLDRHCPRCGSPLFEKEGRVFCPVCEHRRGNSDIEGALMEKLAELASSLPDDLNELEKHLNVMEKIMEAVEKYRDLEGRK